MIEALDSINNLEENISAPLRFPIQDVYKFDERRIIAGRIESGKLQIGDRIKIFPEGRETVITSIAYWQERDKKSIAQLTRRRWKVKALRESSAKMTLAKLFLS